MTPACSDAADTVCGLRMFAQYVGRGRGWGGGGGAPGCSQDTGTGKYHAPEMSLRSM